VEPRLRQGFPRWEGAAFAAGAQAQGHLPALALPFLAPHRLVLVLGGLGALLAWRRAAAWGDRQRLALALCVLVGVTVNAAATGALSAPHHRYQARIAWLLPLAAVLGLRRPLPGRPSDYDDYGIRHAVSAAAETALPSPDPQQDGKARKPWLRIVGRS
jgi:peptidoglycan/LPS O-acetylase OafA/YrhL